jgi:lipid-binding SYLF domain-containing protein
MFFSNHWRVKDMTMIQISRVLGLCMLLLSGGAVMAAGNGSEKEKDRAEIRKASTAVLSKLYKAQPSARKAIESAAGYATFSNFGMKILVAGSGTGKGVAVKKGGSPKEIFMKMIEVQAGLGFGIKKFNLVFVFQNASAFDRFVNSGWEGSTQATAAASDGNMGASYAGAVSLGSGVWLYQLTDKGVAAEVTVKGTKYYKDDALN